MTSLQLLENNDDIMARRDWRNKMADCDEWFVGEDGCLSVGKPIDSVTYHSTLNTILVATKEPSLQVIDVASGLLLKNSDLSAKSDRIECRYLSGSDKLLFTDGYAVGSRRDLNGILLLDTALQTPVNSTEDMIKIELSFPDATHLFKCLMSAELPGVDYVEDVLRDLEKEIEAVQQSMGANHKVAKWASVRIRLPYCAIKTVCSSLVLELKRLHQHVPGLPVASGITDRMSYLLPSSQSDGGSAAVDRSLMYSEAGRRETFSKWPHMNYKWALPDAMAQAGFYHQPSSTGYDRAMCFTCNVCLVCWEPTDEPWSEHERHSPTCPFVKGEYTQNVPVAVSYSTEPAQPHSSKGNNENIECLSTTSNDDYIASSTIHGNIIVWSISRLLKKHLQFNVDPWDPMIVLKTGTQIMQFKDIGVGGSHTIKEAWPEKEKNGAESEKAKEQDAETSKEKEKENEVEKETDELGEEVPSVQFSSGSESDPSEAAGVEKSGEDNSGKAKVIEVGGIWKHGNVKAGDVIQLPVDDVETVKHEVAHRARPSQDVLVSSLCVLSAPQCSPDKEAGKGAAAASAPSTSEKNCNPCLVAGVAIRRNTLTVNDFQMMCEGATAEVSEVAALNQVNQALSTDTPPQIIVDTPSSNSSSGTQAKPNPFVPYLVLYDIACTNNTPKEVKMKPEKSSISQGTSSGTKVSSLVSTVQEYYMPQIMEMDEEVSVMGPPLLPPLESHQLQATSGASHMVDIPMDIDDEPDVQIVGVQMPPAKYKVASFMYSQPNPKPPKSSSSSKEKKKSSKNREGRVLQCIALPSQVTSDQHITHVVPTLDSQHVVVFTAPKCLHKNIGAASGSRRPSDDNLGDCSTTDSSSDHVSMEACSSQISAGCILIYRANTEREIVLLDDKPVVTCVIDNEQDTATSVLMLPRDVASQHEDDDIRLDDLTDEVMPEVEGQVVITTYGGDVRLLRLMDGHVLATISSPETDKFVSVTYCTGMDRLCASAMSGKLHFFAVGPKSRALSIATECASEASPTKMASSSGKEDVTDGPNTDHIPKPEDLLVHQPPTTEVLLMLHELTQFENLMPRFSATVAPCWSEIQQEQQQRRHPQHLQQQGEAAQHTRTWRLQADNSSWDEHLFELVLSKACPIGHIDFKYTLNPRCTTPPNIQVTLLKQNISSLGRGMTHHNAGGSEVDTKITFPMTPPDSGQDDTTENGGSSSTTTSGKPAPISSEWKNSVHDPVFLKRYGAEVLCGPVDLANFVDLSGHSGIINLTSPLLLKAKARSYLIHVKARVNSPKEFTAADKTDSKASTSTASCTTTSSSEKPKEKVSTSKPIWGPFGTSGSASERLTSAISKQKLENIRGCDWIQEVSITARRSKKTSIPRDRVQRQAIVENLNLQEQLLVVACGQDDKPYMGTSREHRQGLALDILTWVCSLQMNEPRQRQDKSCVVFAVQSNLKGLVKACYIEAGRSIAHKCSKLISLCIEYVKDLPDGSVAPAFNFGLLQALLECLPYIASAYSSGALHWYFTLLNRVKCMDISLTGQKTAEVLTHIARHYSERSNPLHSLLKARFGLYGTPLDPLLFDIDPPLSLKLGANGSSNGGQSVMSNVSCFTSGAVNISAGTSGAATATTTSASSQPSLADEVDFRDLMTLSGGDKLSRSSASGIHRYINGLLEVEPLHFTCHATSDGTRMERMDNGVVSVFGSGLAGSTGTVVAGDAPMSASAAGAALASLSTAMASAEQQLQLLQQKQQQLFKLQQKLAASSKLSGGNSAGGLSPMIGSAAGSAHSTPPSHTPYEFLPPPTPKTTPLFMTPPVTPPNESLMQLLEGVDPGKPPTWKSQGPLLNQMYASKSGSKSSIPNASKGSVPLAATSTMLQPPPPQVLVIERMHSGARRFVVLDFGRPVLLTDVIIPACSDLASLSVDVWVHGEELDGQRLVVATDIDLRSLVMNDLLPPVVCRYLKITTIGRYGGSTTRSRIPIGSFYGHSTLLPWEVEAGSGCTTTTNSNTVATLDQSGVVTQLSSLLALQEDVQCRYSLACTRLSTLLDAVDRPASNTTHTRYYLKRGKRSEEDTRVIHAYNDCMTLQLQLNLAQHALERLQRVLGIYSMQLPTSAQQNGTALLQHASTDKLRVLTELLLDTLLGMTYPSPSIPQLPLSLYATFTPVACQALFRHLCIHGTRRTQMHAGVLLVRLCGNQPWWGDFLGNVFQEYFSCQQPQVFPQDRVFILLTVLGQKCLSGVCAHDMLESILTLLAKLLTPLLTLQQQQQQTYYRPPNQAQLDLSLVGWLLLFLGRNLDNTASQGSEEQGAAKEKENGGSGSSRWDFLQGEAAMQNSRQNTKSNSFKVYRRKLHKRLMYHKQQLLDLQAAKKNFLTAQMEKTLAGGLAPESEVLLKQQEQLFKKHLRQYSSKHFKDIMQIRRTDGELLKKLPKDGSRDVDRDASDMDAEPHLVVSRDKCIPVVRGIMALILSMDFTCNIDLFLIACKVVARLANVARPAISLSEVMSQEELEKLLLLTCNIDHNHGNITWGGSWAGHAITCLLQDLLDGEKMYPVPAEPEGVTDDEIAFAASEAAADAAGSSGSGASVTTSTSTTNGASVSSLEDDAPPAAPAGAASATETSGSEPQGVKLDNESSLIIDMILDDEECEEEANNKLQDYLAELGIKSPTGKSSVTYSMFGSPVVNGNIGPFNWAPNFKNVSNTNVFGADTDKKHKLVEGPWKNIESWKNKLASYVDLRDKGGVMPQGVSTAMDSRLEASIELAAELRLKVMVSLEAEIVQNAMTAALPSAIVGMCKPMSQPQPPATDDEQLSEANLLSNLGQTQLVSSQQMLSQCFNNLFAQLQLQRVNLDTLLSSWLTLNDDTTQDDNNQNTVFDPSKVPSIPLSVNAVSSLLTALAYSPTVPVQTWVLAFQTLSLLANLKSPSVGLGSEPWLATAMVADCNMMPVLIKFLSGTSLGTPIISSHQYTQVGPTATRAFYEFLVRLQLRCAEGNESVLKELLLKLIYTLATERGAFHSGMGPLDAQCKLLVHMLELSYDGVDVSNAISVIEALAILVHQHIASQEKVVCRSTSENMVSARSCFGGLFSNMLRNADSRHVMGDANRDVLLCSLLKLVNILVQVTLPGQGGQQRRSASTPTTDLPIENGFDGQSMTDSIKISQALASSLPSSPLPTPTAPISDDQKEAETDEEKTAEAESGNNQQHSRSCLHFSDVRFPGADQKEAMLTDVVLSHPQIMHHLISALSCCNSNTMAMIIGSRGLQNNMQEMFTGTDPLSVGDAVFQILCTLNRRVTDVKLMLHPLLRYLTCGGRSLALCKLSEPLLWFILCALDCEITLRHFLELGGVEVVCENLVRSNQSVINVSPSLISTIMQYLGNGRATSALPKRTGADTDNDVMHNFAPLGIVSSSSPTAGPADVLIQASPPHRRARSAAWSYHFYPDEAWVDLTITLPCAVLLKEVHILPHLTSLANCPSAVSLEVSRDGVTSTPICSPLQTSGLTLIKLQLLKAEVVTSVTIRLHKPRDSMTIGLSQLMLCGFTAFGDVGVLRPTNIFMPTEDYVSRTSIGWLRLLHHCLTHCKTTSSDVAAAAARIPNLLITCTSLLVSTSAELYSSSMEAVLLQIGLHSVEMGLSLINHLLLNSKASPLPQGQLPLHGKVNGMANESTVDILYQLGTTQDAGTAERVKALLSWLSDSAHVALQRHHSSYLDGQQYTARQLAAIDLPPPSSAHIYCIAAILWYSQELPVTYDLSVIATKDLLSCLYEWSTLLPYDCTQKKAIDTVICSLCNIHPEFFSCLLVWMGVSAHLSAPITDDHKDSSNLRQHTVLTDDVRQQTSYVANALTDDLKEASGVLRGGSSSAHMIPDHGTSSPEFGHMMLDETHLSLLATAAQNCHGLQQLLDAGCVAVLCQALYEFCMQEAIRHADILIHSCVDITDAEKTASSSAASNTTESTPGHSRRNSGSSPSDGSLILGGAVVAPVLRFLAELGRESVMKDYLGSPEASIFWPALLKLLCNTMSQSNLGTSQPSHSSSSHAMTVVQRSAVETATVMFFTNVISCHPENQHLFANVLCDVIRSQSNGTNSFARRLFLQVLLEDEKILVNLSASLPLYKGQTGVSSATMFHPRCGAGHRTRTMYISLQSTFADLIGKVSDTPASITSQLLEEKEERRSGSGASSNADDEKKDTNELGLEVVDQISAAAGLQAKEKRDKLKQSSLPPPPPRPPSRRGHRPPEQALPSSVYLLHHNIYHSLLPGQALPNDMTLSQLLVLLHGRGFAHGQAMLELNMKLQPKKVNGVSRPDLNTIDEECDLPCDIVEAEPIPDAVLLDTPALPSPLQVFASVGGLALLAEHLPLLYPEVTRQVSPPPTNQESSNAGGVGNEWVTVESTEDIYEDIYEPMPPSQMGNSSKQSAQLVPSIPPHSLVAFGLFLRLPGYAEVLLKERLRAQCLLRLVLGVTDDGEGGHILTSPVASALPTLPFHVLKTLFDTTPLTTDDGVLLRRMTLEIGAVHLVLACLSVLSHHAPRVPIPGFHQEIIQAATQAATSLSTTTTTTTQKPVDDKGQSYWAKGTGFGTGSTTSSWDAEQALLRQRSEEEHVTCLLQVLSSYVNPGGEIPADFDSHSHHSHHHGDNTDSEKNNLPAVLPELLCQSCLIPTISSYLRNDSVLDMARHVPLYRSLLELLRALAVCTNLVSLLLPLERSDDATASVSSLLEKMKVCVDTYANRLKSNKNKSSGGKTKQEEEESEGLALLIPDIQETAQIVHVAASHVREISAESEGIEEEGCSDLMGGASRTDHSHEQRYIDNMRELQFDTFEMVNDEEGTIKFRYPHHYESNVKAAGEINNPSRARRLAQEAVTLSTSLPLSYNSSVFVRCDEERLDIMKVLITGPSDTPYANGCFEFDVYFPQDYPNSPPLINLETTGNHTVRFNPNLYNDGKVCLSVLNTWHGRPEEKWNPQTSSFLQVLVSIQSLILVNEPYFNEPGYERSRGTPSGTASSREYDANIRQATVKWAMLEQLRNASTGFKDVIRRHFWLKRQEVMQQIEGWITELESNSTSKRMGRTISQSCVALKRHYNQLKEELLRMKAPDGLEDEGIISDEEDSQVASGSSEVVTPSSDQAKIVESCSSSDESSQECKGPPVNGPKHHGANPTVSDYHHAKPGQGSMMECMGNGEIESDEEFPHSSVEC